MKRRTYFLNYCYRFSAFIIPVVLISLPIRGPFDADHLFQVANAAELISDRYIRIQKEDTISEALEHFFPNHLWRFWGKKGSIAKVIRLNPHLSDVNSIRPGSVVDIGDLAERQVGTNVNSTPLHAPRSNRTIATEPDPKSTPNSHLPSVNTRYGILSLTPEFSFSKIDSIDKTNGSSATYLSNFTPGLKLGWAHHWNDRFQTSLTLGAKSETYTAPPGTDLKNTNPILADFGAGAILVPFSTLSDFSIDGRIGVRQQIFMRSTGLNSTTIEAVMIPEAMFGLRYRVFEFSPFSMSLNASAILLLPNKNSTYTISTGFGSTYGMTLSEDLSKLIRLSGSFWYLSQTQNSNIATQTKTGLGINLGIIFRFDPVSDPDAVKRGDL